MASLVARSDFELPDGLIHLAPGGESPSLRTHRAVLERYFASKGTGPAGQRTREEVTQSVRGLAAELFGLPGAETIAFVPSVSDGMNALSHALPVRAGDNVVIEDREFGAVLYPWLHLERQGVEVRLVRQRDWEPAEGAFRAAIDARTRAVACSQVSFLTGLHHNLEALAELARARGAWLVVDATHAAGAVPVPGPLCDFVLSACYKWLLGWHGVALLGWNRERVPEIEPALLGWKTPEAVPDREQPKTYVRSSDATRLEIGNPSYVGIFVLENALRYLQAIGIERIAEHDRALSGRLNRALRELGLDVATPLDANYRAGNTCFWHAEPQALATKLAAESIWVNGSDGRIRMGTHLWCGEADVEAAVVAVDRAIG
ncbi:MAG TPA: aminotransferase class V-fold PLP-dependent enzyme [Dehalococcoidia bacterium]|nr:aminotransferase class V-fold PLP-dependent enzyme [Dehalococcoidia bacterium]